MVNIQRLRHRPISEIRKVLNCESTIDLAKVAQKLNVSIVPYCFMQPSNDSEKILCFFVTNENGKACIFYDVELVDNKKRELLRLALTQTFVRYILTGKEKFRITRSTKFSDRENNLVDELLMPAEKVKEVINKLLFPTPYRLAVMFGVSTEFVKRRLDKMNIRTFMVGYNF